MFATANVGNNEMQAVDIDDKSHKTSYSLKLPVIKCVVMDLVVVVLVTHALLLLQGKKEVCRYPKNVKIILYLSSLCYKFTERIQLFDYVCISTGG